MDNIIGTKINKWTIIANAGKDKWGTKLYKCICDCDNDAIIRKSDLLRNKSVQCINCGYKFGRKHIPVLKSPLAGKGNNFKHGMQNTLTYSTWSGMIKRCSETKGKNYKWYGSRGIKVCDRWLKFENFLEDMGIKPSKMYLDRIDNNLGYFKENCRWVDSIMNSRNRRCVKKNYLEMTR